MTLTECEAALTEAWDRQKAGYAEIDRLTALSYRLREQEPGNRVPVRSRFLTRDEYQERWGDRQLTLDVEGGE